MEETAVDGENYRLFTDKLYHIKFYGVRFAMSGIRTQFNKETFFLFSELTKIHYWEVQYFIRLQPERRFQRR
jgi:hypothetical protein